MKTIGIVASHSAVTTALFRHELHEQFHLRFPEAPPLPAVTNEQHGYATEMAIRRNDLTVVRRLVILAAQQCHVAGAQALVLSNSVLHVATAAIAQTVPIPALHLADAALDEVVTFKGIECVGLLGTRLPAEEKFWQAKAKLRGIELRLPNQKARARVDAIIRDELCRGVVTENRRSELARVCTELQNDGAGVIVCAAPELKLILRPHDTELPAIHALEFQIANAITWSTGTSATDRPSVR